ncbi:tRNA pseudouridine(13) synthase TruD [Gilvimarinus sp. F26214L]|uniref:tRNA pseudouridine(13) synthase TruD n=1 Tax=Gilvimarinus sp. DZF01 TaxID=3461371 RepID=UPI004045FD40
MIKGPVIKGPVMDGSVTDGPSRFSLDFTRAWGTPTVSACFRSQPEDFQVDEDLGFEPSGEGEHLYLHLRKRGQNTQWLAGQIARFSGVRPMDVGYCGLKDRVAVTSQWFSVYLPKGPEPNWKEFNPEGVEVLTVSRHSRKLKPGMHRANRFGIVLRDLQGELSDRLTQVGKAVPNYFGEQRFGCNGGNLEQADRLLVEGQRIKDRKLRGLVMSAARSWLFNLVLSERVRANNWQQCLSGDREDGPTGPLWGRGRSHVGDHTAALESAVLEPWGAWCHGLEHLGLQQERRPLICRPMGFSGELNSGTLKLEFSLAPGQYATAVLREIAELENPSRAG